MLLFLIVVLVLGLAIFAFLNHPQFGKLPSGERLLLIKQSPNYRNNKFQNIKFTPTITEGYNYFAVLYEFFFKRNKNIKPEDAIPSMKTNLFTLSLAENVVVWFGHSSYFMQIDEKRILVDPVFCGSVSPLPFGNKAFKGTEQYNCDDIPEIDFLFISHDHWDHLDYETVKKLQPKIKKVICGLGVGAHLEYWGYDNSIIHEKDWNEKIDLGDNFIIYTTPARHFSGRGLISNKSLWLSYVLQTPTMQIFIGGDSGFDTHFEAIGKQFGTFDLVILENGQYDEKWRYIHILPEEFITVSKFLNAKKILSVHSSKFALGNHSWKEPLQLLVKNNELENLNILTPIIGEKVDLKEENHVFKKWWEDIN